MGNVADNLATKTFAPACQSEFDADGTAIAYDPNAFRSPQFRPKNYGNRGSNLSAPGSKRPGGGRIRASTSETPRNKRNNSSPMTIKSPRAKSKANTQARNSKKK